jgi:hypothetical protein
MTVSARDLPESRFKRRLYHVIVGLVAAWVSWSALAWNGRERAASSALGSARERFEAGRTTADAVAAECGLKPFSDERSLQRFPMERPPFPTRKESECLKKVTQVRSELINDRFELDKAVPLAAETGAAARRRLMFAAACLTIFIVGVYATEFHTRLRAASRGSQA